MILLGLDQSSVATGWAMGSPGATPLFGTYKPPKMNNDADYAPFLCGTQTFLSGMLRDHAVTHLIFEQPFMPRASIKWIKKSGGRPAPIAVVATNIHTLRKLYAVAGLIELTCAEHGVDCTETNINKWRPWFLKQGKGIAKPKGTKALKEAVMQQARAHGWEPGNDNEGDALGLWAHACHVMSKRMTITDDLFRVRS